MAAVYFKRYRMQFDLRSTEVSTVPIATDFQWLEWDNRLVNQHALAKWESFRREMDACVFPCLGDKDGCKRLMRDLSERENFIPESTWLAVHLENNTRVGQAVGTIQGLRTNADLGSIQNIGVIPTFRGRGVAKELIRRALHGFRSVGCRIVNLEVTIHNLQAIKLYESIGFRRIETVFKVGNLNLDQ